jgi:hypothetical protein
LNCGWSARSSNATFRGSALPPSCTCPESCCYALLGYTRRSHRSALKGSASARFPWSDQSGDFEAWCVLLFFEALAIRPLWFWIKAQRHSSPDRFVYYWSFYPV